MIWAQQVSMPPTAGSHFRVTNLTGAVEVAFILHLSRSETSGGRCAFLPRDEYDSERQQRASIQQPVQI